jgi:poly(3-hydroxybutyrate) depolymerase
MELGPSGEYCKAAQWNDPGSPHHEYLSRSKLSKCIVEHPTIPDREERSRAMRVLRTVAITAVSVALVSVTVTGLAQREATPRGNPGQRGRGDPPPVAGVQQRTYRFPETNEKIEYDVFVSRKVDKKKKSPLIVALHGANEQPMGLMRSLTGLADSGGYIVAAPTGYNLEGGFGVNGLRTTSTIPANLAELSEKDVMNVLDLMRKDFNVDDHRIYLLGQSMGGGGALHLGVKFSNIWAAIGLSAPAMSTQQPVLLESIKDMPVILVHGDADTTVALARILPWVDKMRELKMTYEYYEMPGVGHHDAIENGASRIFAFFDKHAKPESNH